MANAWRAYRMDEAWREYVVKQSEIILATYGYVYDVEGPDHRIVDATDNLDEALAVAEADGGRVREVRRGRWWGSPIVRYHSGTPPEDSTAC
jgi:hypothetical protein